MANKPVITLEIGAAVNSSMGAALNATKDSIDKLQVNLNRALTLDVDISTYLYAAARLEDAQRNGVTSVGKLQSAMDRQLNVLRAQGLEVKDLKETYEALGEAIKGHRLQAQGLEQIAQGRAGLAAMPGLSKVAAKPVTVSADYQAQLRDIRLSTGMDAASEADVSREVIATSRNTGMSRSQVVQLLGQMIDKGMSLQAARDNLPTAATFAAGQKAAIGDTAGLVRSLQLAKVESPEKVREALTLLATQAKAGGFNSAELAKWVPTLLPSLEGEYEGVAAVGEIGALLQAQMSDANGTDEAGKKVGEYLAASRKAKDSAAAQDPKPFTGDPGVLQRMRAPAGLTDSALENDLQASQALSAQKWSQSADALDDLQRSLGDGMRPVTDILADGATYTLHKLTDLADACPVVVTALTGIAATMAAVGTGYRSWQVGKGVLDLGKGLFKERGALKQKALSEVLSQASDATALGGTRPVDVRVVNFDRLRGPGKGRRGSKRNAKASAAQRPPASVVEAARVGPAKRAGGKAPAASPGGFGMGFAGAPGASAIRHQGPLPHSVIAQSSGSLPVPASGHAGVSRYSPRLQGGGAFASLGRGLFRRLPGVSLMDTGLQIAQIYRGNGSRQEKLEGYGTAVGGLGGALAGAAAGAAIGSVVPVVGTAIGGLIGGVLGGAGGERLGGWLAKAWSSMSTPDKPLVKHEAPSAPAQVGAVARDLGAAATALPTAVATPGVPPTASPTTVNQQFTFTSNMPVTFNNNLDDPSVLQQLEAIARRQLEELMRQARPAQLFDTPHIAL